MITEALGVGTWRATSVNWLWMEQVARLLIQFFLSLILARMLTPAEFGLAASVAIVVGLSTSLADPGVSSAVVQWKQPTPLLEAAAAWSALGGGLIAALVVVVLAPNISTFLGESSLEDALYLTAVAVVLTSFTAVRSGLLIRMQRFRAQAAIAITSAIGSAAVGVFAAAAGYGVLSIFLMPIIGAAITGAAQWLMLGRVHQMRTNRSSLVSVLSSVRYLVGVRITDALQSGIANATIAKSASFAELGLFNRAEGVKQMPITLASAIIGRLYFPRFAAAARVGNDKRAASAELIVATRYVMLPSLPVFALIFSFSHEIVSFLYGEKWVDAAPILQMLLPGAAFYLLHLLYANFLLGLNGSKSYFWLDLSKKVLLIAAIILVPLGSTIIYAMGLSACWVVISTLYFFQCHRVGFMVPDRWLRTALSYAVAAAAMMLALQSVIMLGRRLDNPVLLYVLSVLVAMLSPVIYLSVGLLSVAELKGLFGVRLRKSSLSHPS